jgi:putative transposase
VPRPHRILASGLVYHITARGNGKAPMFLQEADYEVFLSGLSVARHLDGVLCHAYCLMPNHYHLALTTPQPNLGSGMGRLNQVYAQWFNHRHDRVGHLFEQRYWSRLFEAEARFYAVARYIVENPVRAGLADKPNGYPWSSARAMNGATPPPRFLDLAWVRELGTECHESVTTSAPPPFGV